MKSEAQRAYEILERRFTEEFENLMFEVLVHKYLYHQLGRPMITDHGYDALKSKWLSLAQKLNIDMSVYPYDIEFPFSHPMAKEVAAKGKSLWGIE